MAALRDRFLVALMALEGCRTVEMHRATIEDIVRQGTDVGLRVQGKRSSRIVPLTPDLADLLERYLRRRRRDGEKLSSDLPLFTSLAHGTKGQCLSRRSIQRIVERYFKLNGWKQPSLKSHQPITEKSQKKTDLQISDKLGVLPSAVEVQSQKPKDLNPTDSLNTDCPNLSRFIPGDAKVGNQTEHPAKPRLKKERRNRSPQRHLTTHSLRVSAKPE